MKDSLFFDTSILFYAFTLDEPKKHEICKRLVKSVFHGKKKGVLSNQVLAELYAVLAHKRKIEKSKVSIVIDSFILSDRWEKINYNHGTIERAKKISVEFGLGFWDSLIAATLLEHGIRNICTENEKDFKKIKELKVMNPFRRK